MGIEKISLVKYITFTTLAFFIVISTVHAEHGPTVEAQFRGLEEKWANALIDADLDTVSALMHRDFRLIRTYSDGPPISKEMYLGMQGMSVTTAEVISLSVLEYTGNVAVVRNSWTLDWQQEGVGKLPPNFDVIDTWIKDKEEGWLILSRVSLLVK